MPTKNKLLILSWLVFTLINIYIARYHQQAKLPVADKKLLSSNLKLLEGKFTKVEKSTTTSLSKQGNVEPRWIIGEEKTPVKLAIGVLTIERKSNDYIFTTMRWLIDRASPTPREDIVFIIYVADAEDDVARRRGNKLKEHFQKEIENKRVLIISAPEVLHPNWEAQLYPSFGDTIGRVRWRTKQNLDMQFVFSFARRHYNPEYFMTMEDDFQPEQGYADTILKFAVEKPPNEWVYCDFVDKVSGAAKLFHRDSMREFELILDIFWNSKPKDWLMWDYARGKVCGYGESESECKTKEALVSRKHRQLFLHIGSESSMENPEFHEEMAPMDKVKLIERILQSRYQILMQAPHFQG